MEISDHCHAHINAPGFDLREAFRETTHGSCELNLATLAKGALRQEFLATGGNPAEFPSEFVLLQGAYFTGLLALVYIPTYTILAAIGADILESAYPIIAPDLDWENLSRLQANRKSLEEILQLRSGAVDNLRASVSILSPVATGVITVLLGTK